MTNYADEFVDEVGPLPECAKCGLTVGVCECKTSKWEPSAIQETMKTSACANGEHSHCGGQLKFANADNCDDCHPCQCACHTKVRHACVVAETYPIEDFWETQVVRNAEVIYVSKGKNRAESRKGAEMFCALWKEIERQSQIPSPLTPPLEVSCAHKWKSFNGIAICSECGLMLYVPK